MTDPFTSDGAKTPPKPFTIEEGRRKVRSFVLRRAAKTSVYEAFQRVATRRPNLLAGCGLRPFAICPATVKTILR